MRKRGRPGSGPGRQRSAQFDLKRHLLKAAVVGAVLFAIYYANWSFGWITPDDLDLYTPLVAATD